MSSHASSYRSIPSVFATTIHRRAAAPHSVTQPPAKRVMRPAPTTLAVATMLCTCGAGAETIDFSHPGVEVRVEPNTEFNVEIVNVNKLKYNYSYSLEKRTIPIGPLQWPAARAADRTTLAEREMLRQTPICATPADHIKDKLNGIEEERHIELSVADLLNESERCDAATKERIEEYLDLATTLQIPKDDKTFALQKGEELELTVSRAGLQAPMKTTFTTGPRGEFRTSFGFMFIPTNDDEFFFSQVDKDMFRIAKERDADGFDFAPSVFFTWISGGQSNKNMAHGPTFGLGYDLDAPTVFVGYSATFNSNVTLAGGAVLHEQQRLAGRFTEDQIVQENTADLTEGEYRFNYFLGIALALQSNPFSTSP